MNTSVPSPLPWQDPDWQKQAHDWIRAQAAHRSIRLTGEIEQPHVVPWSTVLKVPSREGTLFFKATAPETVYEAALTELLAGLYPDCMPELVAVDVQRGWMLMRDGGEPLRASIRPTRDIRPWDPVISRYSEIQVGLAEHVVQILSLGIPDHRLAALPALYDQLLQDEETLLIDREKGLTSDEVRNLLNLRPRFERICAELASFGIPESLNHGDFHDGQVLLRDGRITFFDWGDASVTHPFVSLRTFFVSIEIALDLEEYAFTPEMAALLDRYLEPWQKFASRERLLKAYRLSKPVASIVKALAWHRTVAPLKGALRAEYEHIVPAVLKEFVVYEKLMSS